MPTSSLDGYAFTNAGALTTTWTAAASCTSGIRLGGVAPTNAPHPARFLEQCEFNDDDWIGGPRWGDCIPSGEAIDEFIRSRTDSGNPHTFLAYHSPGFHCPASWTTAGVAVKGEGGSISATGVFSVTEFTVQSGRVTEVVSLPTSEPWPNKMAHALDEGETAVVCCPSGYSVWEYGACYSNFPIESIQSTTLCMPIHSPFGEDVPDTFTYNNEVVTGADYSATGTSPPEIEFTATLVFVEETSEPDNLPDDAETAPRSEYTGHTSIPMVVLVRTSDDDDSGSDNGGDGNGNGGGDGDGDNGNAGSSLSVSLVTLVAAWSVAGALGALFMAPL